MNEILNKSRIDARLSDGTAVKGTMNIYKYNRLSDYLNSPDSDRFLKIFDATVSGSKANVIIINRDYIIWAVPEE